METKIYETEMIWCYFRFLIFFCVCDHFFLIVLLLWSFKNCFFGGVNLGHILLSWSSFLVSFSFFIQVFT